MDKLIAAIVNRIPYRELSKILKKRKLKSGLGKDNILKNLKSFSEQSEENKKAVMKLKEDYINHLLIGEKTVRLFKCNSELIQEIINVASSLTIEDSVFKEGYPYPLDIEDLNKVEESYPYLVEKINSQNGLALIFCTKRMFLEKVELNNNEISSEVSENYDQVFGVKKYYKQFFDVVYINETKNIVELRLDFYRGPNVKDSSLSYSQVFNQFISLMNLDSLSNHLKPINFFPLLNSMYDNPNEGLVCELGFTTSESSTKHAKMRRTHNDSLKDLRKEKFHEAGSAATIITPFKLAVSWNKPEDDKHRLELLLPGKFRTLTSHPPTIEEANIFHCYELSDYLFVVNKMLSHLS